MIHSNRTSSSILNTSTVLQALLFASHLVSVLLPNPDQAAVQVKQNTRHACIGDRSVCRGLFRECTMFQEVGGKQKRLPFPQQTSGQSLGPRPSSQWDLSPAFGGFVRRPRCRPNPSHNPTPGGWWAAVYGWSGGAQSRHSLQYRTPSALARISPWPDHQPRSENESRSARSARLQSHPEQGSENEKENN